MATVVNNPSSGNGGNGMGFFLGMIVLLVIVVLFFIYGLPLLRQSTAPQVNVPGKIDVNVQNGSK